MNFWHPPTDGPVVTVILVALGLLCLPVMLPIRIVQMLKAHRPHAA